MNSFIKGNETSIQSQLKELNDKLIKTMNETSGPKTSKQSIDPEVLSKTIMEKIEASRQNIEKS